VMLSRVADSLYWMGRYVERAENVCRLILVTTEISAESEGLDESVAQAEWDTLLRAIPGSDSARLEFSPASGLGVPYISALLFDPGNPVSVHSSLARARENARVSREAISREVFQNLNTAYRDLDRLRRKRAMNPTFALESVAGTHRAVLTTVGAMVHTLSRDQGWIYLRLGEALERTLRTLLILRAKLPTVVTAEPGIDLPLLYARRRALLRSLSCLEAFRRVHGAALSPDRIIEFLIFNDAAPRSIRGGVRTILDLLDQLPDGSSISAADRITGRLAAELTYDDAQILSEPDVASFLDHAIHEIEQAHEAVTRQYFEG